MRGSAWMFVFLGLAAGCQFDPSGLAGGGAPDAARGPADGGPDSGSDGGDGTWWRSEYRLRRQITIAAGSAAVPAGASVFFTADTAQLVQAGDARADDNDWRLVRHTAGGFEELARWIDDGPGGGWESAGTTTWFRVPADIAADGTDTATYLYYDNPGEESPAPADMNDVFLFGDDFESGLDLWESNEPSVQHRTREIEGGAGAQALEIIPGQRSGAGIYHDLDLPEQPLVFTHYLRQNTSDASFGNLRVYGTGCAGLEPDWIHADLRGASELDSSGALQFWFGGVENFDYSDWHADYGVDDWHAVTFLYDLPRHRYKGRVDDGPWSDEYEDMDDSATSTGCVALEGEGQGGVFLIDNYIIRLHIDPAPTVTPGPVETAP